MNTPSTNSCSASGVYGNALGFFVSALLCLAYISIGPACAQESSDDLPFRAGEKLFFEARWEFIKAGEAVLEILPVEEFGGVETYHFVMTVRTMPYADLFYKVRDRMDSYTDTAMTHSLLYKQRQRGKRKRDIVVTMDWEQSQAQYSNSGEQRPPIALMSGAFDPLSVFYAFRAMQLVVDRELRVPVTDGKKCVLGKGKVIRRERIRTQMGEFDTFLVEPSLEHIGGVFAKSKDAKLKIWVTADQWKIPVRVQSQVVVGSFYAELTAVEGVGP